MEIVLLFRVNRHLHLKPSSMTVFDVGERHDLLTTLGLNVIHLVRQIGYLEFVLHLRKIVGIEVEIDVGACPDMPGPNGADQAGAKVGEVFHDIHCSLAHGLKSGGPFFPLGRLGDKKYLPMDLLIGGQNFGALTAGSLSFSLVILFVFSAIE